MKHQKKYPYRPLFCECGKNLEGIDSNFCEECIDAYMKKISNKSEERAEHTFIHSHG